MFHRIEDWQQLPAPRYFKLAERLVYYEGATRGAIAVARARELEQTQRQEPPDLRLLTAAAQQQVVQQKTPTVTSIASPDLPTYSGEALEAMTDDGGLGLPGIEYDGS